MTLNFDQILNELESRWNRDPEVELAAFLSEHGIVPHHAGSTLETARLLLEAVQIDLERRWMSQGRLRIPAVAQYLEQFPSLSTAKTREQLEAFDRSLRRRSPPLALLDIPQLARTTLAPGEPPHEEFSPRRNDFRDGQMFGPYRIVRKIGEGGMGAVYQAVQEHLGKSVAIKVLSSKLGHDEDVIARFRREMKAVGLIEHPNVVRAMDAGVIGDTHFLVTEFVDGTDLARLIQTGGPVSVREACRIIRQAADALSAAHAQGLVHRDIKPSNLMLTTTGQVKLLDLGLTRLTAETEQLTSELTVAGNTFGTPDYMAPEQWEDARDTDARTDLYALGCTLYFLLVGRAPFATDRFRSAYNKMKAHAEAEIPNVADCRTDVPEELSEVIGKLLAKRREHRFQSASDLITAVDAIEHPGPGSAVIAPTSNVASQESATARLANVTPSQASESSPTTRPTLTPTSRLSRATSTRWLLVILVVVVLFVTPFIPSLFPTTSKLAQNSQTATPTTAPASEIAPPQVEPRFTVAALEFDGLDDRVDIPSFEFDWSKPFTWEAIVEPLPDKVRLSTDKTAFADPLFRHTNQDLSGFNILFDRVASHWFLIHRPSAGSPYNYYSVPCNSTSNPRHLAVVYTGQELSLYENRNKQPLKHHSQLKAAADSQQVDLKTYNSSSGSLGQDIYFAKDITRLFRGRLSHLQLSEGTRAPNDFTLEPGSAVANSTTALLYQFERREGDQLRDLSPHQRHGWIRGAHWVSRSADNREPKTQIEPSLQTAAQTEASASARQLVHSVVNAGGSVEIQFDSAHGLVSVNRDNVTELPERPFLIRTIVLTQATPWPEQQQTLLCNLHFLNWIRLDDVSHHGFEALSEMDVSGVFVIGADSELRILRNRGIQAMSIMGHLGDAAAWKQLRDMPRLDVLSIGSSGRISMQALAHCSSLRSLTLNLSESVPDDVLETLASLPQLTELKIEGPVGDSLLHMLEPAKRLKVLNIAKAGQVTESGVRSLVAARPDLIVVHPSLRATEAEIATMKLIDASHGSLQVVTLSEQPWTAQTAEPFVPHDLHFHNGRLADFAQVLRELRYLISVRCPSTGDPDELVKLFKLQPSLRHVSMDARGLSAEGLRGLAAQSELLQLNLHSCPKLSGEEWGAIANCQRLRMLTLVDGSKISDTVLAQIARCEQLDTLIIQNSPRLTAAGLLPLQSLSWLRELDLSRSSLDDSAVENLARLKSLRVLHLDGSRVTQAGIDRLRTALPKCAIFWKNTVVLPSARRAS